ncbi:MAG: glycosyltransferase family 2 protein [Clostridia bacterium]|nr:glycosyltransferase family 2 protein [Clostridia bacterium]
MSNKKISVIVPIYNVEQYIIECLDSIVNQSYKKLEIILVDDGSPDNCGKICDEYAKKDSRIKVIHQENGGLSAARNAGLDVATGEYIGFVDSDDYIEMNFFEELLKSIEEYHASLAVCGVKKFGLENRMESYGNKQLSSSEYLKALLCGTVKSYSCNKLYKASLFEIIRFPNGEMFEDLKIMHLIGEKTTLVSFTDKTFYNYRIRQNSITFNNKGTKAKDYLTATHNRSERYKGTELFIFAIAGEFRSLRVIVSDMSWNKEKEYRDLFNQSKQLFKICKKEIKGFQKLLSYIYLISPKLYLLLKKIALNISSIDI